MKTAEGLVIRRRRLGLELAGGALRSRHRRDESIRSVCVGELVDSFREGCGNAGQLEGVMKNLVHMRGHPNCVEDGVTD